MGSLLQLGSLFQILIARKLSPPPLPPCVHKWSSFSLFLRTPHPQVFSTQISVGNVATRYKGTCLPALPSPGPGHWQELKGKKKNPLPVTSQVPIHHPQTLGTSGPSPPAPSRGRLFQPPRPRACGTGGRLMGQVLVPGAGPCPDKVGAEIALGQYSAVATWSCSWSHLRGSREERTLGVLPPCVVQLCPAGDAAFVRRNSSLRCAGGDLLLLAGPPVPPGHLLSLPAPSHRLSLHSPAPGAKPRFQPSPAVNNS